MCAGLALFRLDCQEWGMFFIASKVLAVLLEPLAHPYILIALALALRVVRMKRAMRACIALALMLPLLYAFLPISTAPLRALENIHAVPKIGNVPDGIIVLGGHTADGVVSQTRGQPQQSAAADRLTKGLMLHRQFPQSQLIFSGYSGELTPRGWSEAETIRRLLEELGVDSAGVTFEVTSRNTWQNAVNTLEIAVPQPGSRWILVTSAAHMPRAVGAFTAAGWGGIIPYPTDYQTTPENDGWFHPQNGFAAVRKALHEYVGWVAYWLTGRSSRPFS